MNIWFWVLSYSIAALLTLGSAFGLTYYERRRGPNWAVFAARTAFKFLLCALLCIFIGGDLSPRTDGPDRFALNAFLPFTLIGALLLSGLAFLLAAWLVWVVPSLSRSAPAPRRQKQLALPLNAAAAATGLLLGCWTYFAG